MENEQIIRRKEGGLIVTYTQWGEVVTTESVGEKKGVMAHVFMVVLELAQREAAEASAGVRSNGRKNLGTGGF